MKPIIKVENLSKQYRLGVVGTGTISHDLKRWYYKTIKNEDPYLKLGDVNDRTSVGSSEYVWALRDISFDVMPGEVIGIIGKNGAGKSTLFKILSKVTGPTTGKIQYNGRIGALLEVGTGFHPELTGRENIFLNGAILGMTKREIRAKLDEIIDFSGCERYIDTPSKRYSSGMKVRLGFAVAAHLEPEILVVDEVLAVGDAEFQKKAVGKMKDVSQNQGRTVLFVSHNMQAVSNLTMKSVLLENGMMTNFDTTDLIIDQYINSSSVNKTYVNDGPMVTDAVVREINLDTSYEHNCHEHGDELNINISLEVKEPLKEAAIAVYVYNVRDERVLHFYNESKDIPFLGQKGIWKAKLTIPKARLYPDRYYLSVIVWDQTIRKRIVNIKETCSFEVEVRKEVRINYWKPKNALYVEDSVWEFEYA